VRQWISRCPWMGSWRGSGDGLGRDLGDGGEPVHNRVMVGRGRTTRGHPSRRRESTSRPHPTRTVGSTTYTFVTDGIRSALRQAQVVAADRRSPWATVPRMQIHVAPVLVGDGTRLFEHLGDSLPRLDQLGVRASPSATHIRYPAVPTWRRHSTVAHHTAYHLARLGYQGSATKG